MLLLLLGVDGLQTGQWSRLTPHRRATAPWLSAAGPAAHDHEQIETDMRQIVQNVPCLQDALDAAVSESELAYVGQLHADFTRHTDYLTAGSDAAAATLRQGVAVAFLAHRGQRRKSGEPFVIHPMQVATILAQTKMDLPSVTAGLLHDTVEDTAITFDDVKILFGEEVRMIVELTRTRTRTPTPTRILTLTTDPDPNPNPDPHQVMKIVEGETKVSKLTSVKRSSEELGSSDDPAAAARGPDGASPGGGGGDGDEQLLKRKKAEQAENLRSMFVAMADDWRIVGVKLADRLHNMRTLQHMPPHKRLAIARETLEIFAPLAHRLGMWQYKEELVSSE